MKRIVAIVLTLVMAFAVCIPVFADNTLPSAEAKEHYLSSKLLDEENQSGSVYVLYNVSAQYQVRIPDNVMFVNGDKGLKFLADVEATGVAIVEGAVLNVEVTSKNEFEMKEEGSAKEGVPYKVGFIKNKAYGEGEFTWPSPTDEKPLLGDLLAEMSGYAELSSTNKTILSVDGIGRPVNYTGTTLMFYTNGTDVLGNYQDMLTFTVSISEPQNS